MGWVKTKILGLPLMTTDDSWPLLELPIGALYTDINVDRRVLEYGLHCVLRVTICGFLGMKDAEVVVP